MRSARGLMITIAIKTGLRSGELIALRWEDVDLVAGRIIVRRSMWNGIEGTPKSGRQREVPLSDAAIATLKKHRELNGPLKSPYVFSREGGKPFTLSRIKQVIPGVCAKAGPSKRLTWHDLRHTFASHLVMRGVAPAAVKDLLGHAHIATTMIYAHLSPNVARDAVKLLDGGPHSTLAAHGS